MVRIPSVEIIERVKDECVRERGHFDEGEGRYYVVKDGRWSQPLPDDGKDEITPVLQEVADRLDLDLERVRDTVHIVNMYPMGQWGYALFGGRK